MSGESGEGGGGNAGGSTHVAASGDHGARDGSTHQEEQLVASSRRKNATAATAAKAGAKGGAQTSPSWSLCVVMGSPSVPQSRLGAVCVSDKAISLADGAVFSFDRVVACDVTTPRSLAAVCDRLTSNVATQATRGRHTCLLAAGPVFHGALGTCHGACVSQQAQWPVLCCCLFVSLFLF